jgi:hypothetical protein
MKYDERRVIKIHLAIPKGNFSGITRKGYPLAGESPWALHLDAISIPEHADLNGKLGVGVLLNVPFLASYVNALDIVVYAQRNDMLAEVIASFPNPWSPWPNPKKPDVAIDYKSYFEEYGDRIAKLAIPLLKKFKPLAVKSIPKLPAPPTCDRCGKEWTLWMVSNKQWRLVGRKWLHTRICWDCYVELTQGKKGAARKPVDSAELWRRAEARHAKRRRKS